MRSNEEYQLCKNISLYMNLQYPNVFYHFDAAGLNLSKSQAGMQKAIQKGRGFPDLFIAEARGGYHGLFIELKKAGERILKATGEPVTKHIQEQMNCINLLNAKDYHACFCVGFDNAKAIIDQYLSWE